MHQRCTIRKLIITQVMIELELDGGDVETAGVKTARVELVVDDTLTFSYSTARIAFQSYWVLSGNTKRSSNVGYAFGSPSLCSTPSTP